MECLARTPQRIAKLTKGSFWAWKSADVLVAIHLSTAGAAIIRTADPCTVVGDIHIPSMQMVNGWYNHAP